LCVKCLKEYHGKNCKTFNCKLCKGFHNTLLHKSKPQEGDTNNNETRASHSDFSPNSIKSYDTKQIATASSTSPLSIDLNHCIIKSLSSPSLYSLIIDPQFAWGNKYKCRALLDSGSQSNLITRQLCDKLKLKHKTINKTIMGISDTPINTVQQVNAIIRVQASIKRSFPS